jgi:hypothetical protein
MVLRTALAQVKPKKRIMKRPLKVCFLKITHQFCDEVISSDMPISQTGNSDSLTEWIRAKLLRVGKVFGAGA